MEKFIVQSVLKKYSYRSITDIVNEAAKMARKSGRSEIEKEDILKAIKNTEHQKIDVTSYTKKQKVKKY